MFNFVMFVLGLGLFSGSLKPDLVSLDIGSIQVGVGYGKDWNGDILIPMLPDLSFSIGQVRTYWGKTTAFAVGLEIFRAEVAGSELITPQVGLSFMLGPAQQRFFRPGCTSSVFYSINYIPRLDIVSGVSIFNPVLTPSFGGIYSLTLRNEVKLSINRGLSLTIENPNVWLRGVHNGPLEPFCSTISVSVCVALGNDYIIDKNGSESKEQTE